MQVGEPAEGHEQPPAPRRAGLRRLAGQQDHAADVGAGGRLSHQVHQEGEAAAAVTDQEQGPARVRPDRLERGRHVEEAERLEAGVGDHALARSVAAELEDPAIEPVRREVVGQPRADRRVGERAVGEDDRVAGVRRSDDPVSASSTPSSARTR